MAGAAIVLAESAKEVDLIWMALPSACNEVREQLLEVVLMRAREMGADSLLCYLAESDTENLSFMDSEVCKAEAVAGYSRWATDLGYVVEAQAPEGTSVHVSDDSDALLQATRAAWDDLPGHKPATRAAVMEAMEAFGAANQFLLLNGSGSPVGLVRGVMISENEAYIDAPGLAPEWRKPGNYAFLLTEASGHLARLGARTAVLESWGDPPGAMAGFRSAGWARQSTMPARRIPVERITLRRVS